MIEKVDMFHCTQQLFHAFVAFCCLGDIGSGYSGHGHGGAEAAQQIVKVIKITSKIFQYHFCIGNLCAKVLLALAILTIKI